MTFLTFYTKKFRTVPLSPKKAPFIERENILGNKRIFYLFYNKIKFFLAKKCSQRILGV